MIHLLSDCHIEVRTQINVRLEEWVKSVKAMRMGFEELNFLRENFQSYHVPLVLVVVILVMQGSANVKQ